MNTTCGESSRIMSIVMRVLTALLTVAALLGAANPAVAQRFLRGSDVTFTVKDITPQELALRPNVNYDPRDKFPDYEMVNRLALETPVRRSEYTVGDRLELVFEATRDGYVSLLDYRSDGRAAVLLQNRPVSRRFRYSFTGETTEPAGRDWIRALFTSRPLTYASYKTLCEYPFTPDYPVRYVAAERWMEIDVRPSRYRGYGDTADPFYRHPRRWYRGDDRGYLFAQPYYDAVLTRGLTVETEAQVLNDLTSYGTASYWLLLPGEELELSFETGSFTFTSPEIYLLLYMAADVPGVPGLYESHDRQQLRVRFNGMTVTDEYRPKFADFYEDSPPEIIRLNDFLLYGTNSVELQLDPFAETALRIRRIEIRTSLDGISTGAMAPENPGW